MTEITIRHVVSLCPRTQALIEQLAAALRSTAQPPSAVSPSPPQTEVPGVSGPFTIADPPPRAEGPSRAARGTAGEAATPPRTFSEVSPLVMAGVSPATRDVPSEAPVKRPLAPEHVEKLRQNCLTMNAAKVAGQPIIWSPQRLDILRRDYPAGVSLDTILAALSALPGRPVPRERIAIHAASLGLKRPAKIASPLPPAVESQPAPDPTAMWTPQRDLIVREDYPTRAPIRDMQIDINMLPGPKVELYHIHARAAEMHLTRPGVEKAA